MSVTYRCDVCGRAASDQSLSRRDYGPLEKYSGYPFFTGDVCEPCRRRIAEAATIAEWSEIKRIKAESLEGGDAS